ncbi:hypothetical protein [uncultured Duncaniella sp.]|uniref:hypothetical protein n=1 Tax=uncultured Duncaniella sp. TaxID=2768039 RepID=UPI0025A9552C|nr:hypothetical protein [uncultured Duncaniella sp.]
MKTKLLSLLAITFMMIGCTNDENELFDTFDSQMTEHISRTNETDTIGTDTITPMEITDGMLALRETLDNLKRPMRLIEEEDDPYIDQNIYALRDIPVTITVAEVGPDSNAKRRWIRTRGTGNELMLDYDYKKKNWGFRIKQMPVTTGLNCLLYSDDLNVPITIGKLKNGTAVIMAQANNDKLTDFASWDLIPLKTNPGYFIIQNTRYLGQASQADPFSIFNYTLEAVKGTNLRFSQPIAGKKQQEFLIVPIDGNIKFTLDSIIYNLNSAKITGPYYQEIERSTKNLTYESRNLNISYNFTAKETSSFKTIHGNIFPSIIDTIKPVRRPELLGSVVMGPDNSTQNVNYNLSSQTQLISRRISYLLPVFVKPRHVYKAKLGFKYNYVTIDYEAKAHYFNPNDQTNRELTLSGTWTGRIYQDPNTIAPIVYSTSEIPFEGDSGDTEL